MQWKANPGKFIQTMVQKVVKPKADIEDFAQAAATCLPELETNSALSNSVTAQFHPLYEQYEGYGLVHLTLKGFSGHLIIKLKDEKLCSLTLNGQRVTQTTVPIAEKEVLLKVAQQIRKRLSQELKVTVAG